MWALVGLGNPGKNYAETRHNAGFMLINRYAKKWEISLKVMDKQFRGVKTERGGQEILLAKTRVFMNMSGKAVIRIQEKHQVPLEQLVVAHDDFDIPLGEIRIKKAGSGGSHKGVRSIIESLETQNFPRIRIGIGPVPRGMDPSDFVLSRLKKSEKPLMQESINNAVEAFETILDSSFEKAMNIYNQRRSQD
ncbi:MAG: aminoacyl-tRNA hydrolase [Acidobacteriota bacterium]